MIRVLHYEDIRAFSCKDLGVFLLVLSMGSVVEIIGG